MVSQATKELIDANNLWAELQERGINVLFIAEPTTEQDAEPTPEEDPEEE